MHDASVSRVTPPCGPCHSRVNQLCHQLRMLKSLFKDIEHQTLTTSIIAKTLISMPPVTQELFKDTLIALKSCLNMPVSVATCERLFSALRRLKTYLRSTMTQKILTHCALLYVHSDRVDSLDFLVYEKLRVENEERTNVFGNPNRLLSHCGHQGDQNNEVCSGLARIY